MEIRATERDDVPAANEVFREAIGELYGRHGFPAPGAPLEVFSAQHEHLLAHDAERCFVGEDRGRVVAYTAALVRDDFWFLASLFVLPEYQGRGLGQALLERAWPADVTRRATLTDAIQPVSNGLYARRGLIPQTPVLHLGGEARVAGDVSLEPATSDDGLDVAELDAAAYGFSRARDHAYWRRHAEQTIWRRNGRAEAYSYRFPGGAVGPLAGRTTEAAAEALRAEIARTPDSAASVTVPGTSRALVAAALEAGLRLTRPPGLLLLSADARPPTRLAIAGYTLF